MSDNGTNGKRLENGAKNGEGFVLGLETMVRLHAIENMLITPEMLADFERFEREQIPSDERRRLIIEKYGLPK